MIGPFVRADHVHGLCMDAYWHNDQLEIQALESKNLQTPGRCKGIGHVGFGVVGPKHPGCQHRNQHSPPTSWNPRLPLTVTHCFLRGRYSVHGSSYTPYRPTLHKNSHADFAFHRSRHPCPCRQIDRFRLRCLCLREIREWYQPASAREKPAAA